MGSGQEQVPWLTVAHTRTAHLTWASGTLRSRCGVFLDDFAQYFQTLASLSSAYSHFPLLLLTFRPQAGPFPEFRGLLW